MAVTVVRWGIIGCGDVTEVKSGPAFQKADGSALTAVMRRDRAKAEDYARRHGVPRAYDRAEDLLADPGVDAVYVATPPSSHHALALRVAEAGKPCLVEKPMAVDHGQCLSMIQAFAARGLPLWVAYYRRALPRFLMARDLLSGGAIGTVTSVHIAVQQPLAVPATHEWRLDPSVGGAGLFLDLGSHCLDLVDFLLGPVTEAWGCALNTGGAHSTEDVTAAAFQAGRAVAGTGIWNFNADAARDEMVFTGTAGELRLPVFADADVIVTAGGDRRVHHVRNPPHVHQPLIQTIVDELRGHGRCESTGVSAARASRVMDRCLEAYRMAARGPRA